MISRWAGHRKVLCPVVFLGVSDEAERALVGCPDGVAGTGEEWGRGTSRRGFVPVGVSVRAQISRFVRASPVSSLFASPKLVGKRIAG